MRAMTNTWILVTLLWSAAASAQEALSALQRVKACDPTIAVAAAHEILNQPQSWRDPNGMFIASRALFQNGKKDEALFWFYAAQLRARYQLAFEHGPNDGQLLQVMLMTVGPSINNYGFSNADNLRRTFDRVLEWDAKTPNPLRDGPQTAEQKARVAQVYAGFRQLRDKVGAEGASLERQAKLAVFTQQMDEAERKARCAPGQIDPSLVERESRKETARVVEFVKTHPDVVRAAGGVRTVFVAERTLTRESSMPVRYLVDVIGIGERTIFAEVDVTRSAPEAQFTLRCTTSISPASRPLGQDPCAK